MPEKTPLSAPPLPALIRRFFVGAGLGTLVTVVPFSAGFSAQLNLFQVAFAALVVVSSGVLSCVYGDWFLDAISKALDSTSV